MYWLTLREIAFLSFQLEWSMIFATVFFVDFKPNRNFIWFKIEGKIVALKMALAFAVHLLLSNLKKFFKYIEQFFQYFSKYKNIYIMCCYSDLFTVSVWYAKSFEKSEKNELGLKITQKGSWSYFLKRPTVPKDGSNT